MPTSLVSTLLQVSKLYELHHVMFTSLATAVEFPFSIVNLFVAINFGNE